MSNSFTAGLLEKLGMPGNPASPVKQSLGNGPIDMGPATAYLNMGGGKAGQQGVGDVNVHSPPAQYLNTGGGKAGKQGVGDVGIHGSPDTGEMGTTGGDQTITKSAAFMAGMLDSVESYDDYCSEDDQSEEKLASLIEEMSDEDFVAMLNDFDDDELEKLALSPQTIGSALGKRMKRMGIKGDMMGLRPSDNIKALKLMTSKRGQLYGRAIARKGLDASKAVGGGKSGIVAAALAGRNVSKAGSKALKG